MHAPLNFLLFSLELVSLAANPVQLIPLCPQSLFGSRLRYRGRAAVADGRAKGKSSQRDRDDPARHCSRRSWRLTEVALPNTPMIAPPRMPNNASRESKNSVWMKYREIS